MPADPWAEPKDVGDVVGPGPGLGDVRLERKGAWPDRRARLHLHEPAVGEGEIRHGPEGDAQLRVKAERILAAQPKDAAALGRVGAGRPRAKVDGSGGGGHRRTAETEHVAPPPAEPPPRAAARRRRDRSAATNNGQGDPSSLRSVELRRWGRGPTRRDGREEAR